MVQENENIKNNSIKSTDNPGIKPMKETENKKFHINPHLVTFLVILIIWALIYYPFFYSLPAGIDFAAHLFRLAFFQEYGVDGEWNPLWYTGSPFLEQYPPNTTFFLWLINLFLPLNSAYVFFLVITHLVISLGVYYTSTKLGRNSISSTLCSLFILTLPNLNFSFLFYSRASTHLGIAILIIALGLFYNEKRLSALAMSCLLSLTHFMMFGFFIVIICVSEIIYFIINSYKSIKENQRYTLNEIRKSNIILKQGEDHNLKQVNTILKKEGHLFFKRIIIWVIPFFWVYILMQEFFSQPILALMISFHSLKDYTDGPGIIYWIFRVLRDFIESYISEFVFMFIALFAISLRSERINKKEISIIISAFLITIIGFLMYYHETNEILPLMFRGMDVLRFSLMSQLLIILISIRGVKKWKEALILGLILLLPLAEAHNGVINYGYQDFDDSHWRDLNPVAEELKNRPGYYYACPKGYQGDHMGYLPILSGKPYFDGWNHHGCLLSWYQDTPTSTQKYRPNSTLINDILRSPEKYGVKWMIAGRNDYLFPDHWIRMTTNTNQSKWLWETARNITLINISPNGTAQLKYISPNKINISISTIFNAVNLTIKVAYHPKWVVQGNNNYSIQRENEIGFMKINNVNDREIILVFQSTHVKILLIAFFLNLIIIIFVVLFEHNILRNIYILIKNKQSGSF